MGGDGQGKPLKEVISVFKVLITAAKKVNKEWDRILSKRTAT